MLSKRELKNYILIIYYKTPVKFRFLYPSKISKAVQRKEYNSKIKKQSKVLKRLDEFYHKYMYNDYLEFLSINEKLIIDLKLSKYFSWAALINKGNTESLRYIDLAINIHPTAINDITTAIIIESYPNKDEIVDVVYNSAMKSSKFSMLVFTYCLLKKDNKVVLEKILNKNYIENLYTKEDLLESYSLISKYNEVIDLFKLHKNQWSSVKHYEIAYDSLTKLGMLDEAFSLFSNADNRFLDKQKYLINKIEQHAINNKLERQYWFQFGDYKKAFKTYRRQKLVQVMLEQFPDKYVQTVDIISKSRSPLILASWGPGDEIRFSQIYGSLSRLNSNITVSCDPRLLILMRQHYPNVKFVAVSRTRRVDKNNSKLYNKLPHKKLHHILDNQMFKSLRNYDHICSVTDLISDLIVDNEIVVKPEVVNSNEEYNDNFIPRKVNDECVVGISWCSSVKTASRDEHYFTIEQISPLFNMKNVSFVNLQYGNVKEELDYIKEKYGVIVLQPNIDQYNDFCGVHNLMKSLDYIVSAGTTVLELAGFSGTKTYALTNSNALKYRCSSDNQDFWFSNINYIDNFSLKSKECIVKQIIKEIINDEN